MEAENSARLIKIRQLLFDETDEHDHDLSISEIIEELKQFYPESNFDKNLQ